MAAVVWQLGLVKLLGYGVDPLSILVPFLVLSIGVSHAVQMTNAWRLGVAVRSGFGTAAARQAFNRLFIPGATALVADAVGFAVITVIDIDIIRELGITASIGVAVMLITNKFMLPVILSYLQLSPAELARSHAPEKNADSAVQRWPGGRPRRPVSIVILLFGAVLLVVGVAERRRADHRRFRGRCARVLARFALQPDIHYIVTQVHGGPGRVRGDAPVSQGQRLCRLRRHGDHRRFRLAHAQRAWCAVGEVPVAGGARAQRRQLRGQSQVPRPAAQRADDLGQHLSGRDVAAAVQQRLQRDAGDDLPGRSPGRHAAVASSTAVKEYPGQYSNPDVTFRMAMGNAGIWAATNEAVEESQLGMAVILYRRDWAVLFADVFFVAGRAGVMLPLAWWCRSSPTR